MEGIYNTHIASQGTSKEVKKYVKSLKAALKKDSPEDRQKEAQRGWDTLLKTFGEGPL